MVSPIHLQCCCLYIVLINILSENFSTDPKISSSCFWHYLKTTLALALDQSGCGEINPASYGVIKSSVSSELLSLVWLSTQPVLSGCDFHSCLLGEIPGLFHCLQITFSLITRVITLLLLRLLPHRLFIGESAAGVYCKAGARNAMCLSADFPPLKTGLQNESWKCFLVFVQPEFYLHLKATILGCSDFEKIDITYCMFPLLKICSSLCVTFLHFQTP